MSKTKTTPAAFGVKVAAIGGLFSTFCVAVEPTTAFIFTVVAYVVAIRA